VIQDHHDLLAAAPVGSGGGRQQLQRAVATGDRRKSFKLLMVGPDGGGKSSILFCWKANQALKDADLDTLPTVCSPSPSAPPLRCPRQPPSPHVCCGVLVQVLCRCCILLGAVR